MMRHLRYLVANWMGWDGARLAHNSEVAASNPLGSTSRAGFEHRIGHLQSPYSNASWPWSCLPSRLSALLVLAVEPHWCYRPRYLAILRQRSASMVRQRSMSLAVAGAKLCRCLVCRGGTMPTANLVTLRN